MRHWFRALTLGTVVLLAAWGCGGNEEAADRAPSGSGTVAGASPPSSSDPREDERQIRDVADRFYGAVFSGDGDAACSLLSDAAERQLMEDPETAQYGSTCAAKLVAGGAIIEHFYGSDPETSLTDIKVAGDRATAVSLLAGQRDGVIFERENGEWTFGPEPDDSEFSGGVDRETAAGWPERWCELRVGMTRAQVQEIMGTPTETHAGEQSQDGYDAFQWSFTAFYRYRTDIEDSADEPAYQLQANEGDLTASDRDQITCALTRG